MNCCGDPRDAHFGGAHAKRDIKRYLSKGPDRTSHLILKGIRALSFRNASLLDVGAGVGVMHHELLQDVCTEAIHLDLSSAYIEMAKSESDRRGFRERVQFFHADFTNVDVELPESDVVTLDRVVCCYPDFRAVLNRAILKATNVLALSYPRDKWYTKIIMAFDNFEKVLKRDPFRAFVHPVSEMEALIENAGFVRTSRTETFFWRVSVFERVA